MDQQHVAESSKHEEKTVTIIVNGQEKTWSKNSEISFEEVVNLAFPDHPTGDGVQFTVQYARAEGNKSGSLVEGQSVKVKERMEFDVTPTNRS